MQKFGDDKKEEEATAKPDLLCKLQLPYLNTKYYVLRVAFLTFSFFLFHISFPAPPKSKNCRGKYLGILFNPASILSFLFLIQKQLCGPQQT